MKCSSLLTDWSHNCSSAAPANDTGVGASIRASEGAFVLNVEVHSRATTSGSQFVKHTKSGIVRYNSSIGPHPVCKTITLALFTGAGQSVANDSSILCQL